MDAIWSNPHQRFGFVVVNVLIGAGVTTNDRELFFGPLRDEDIFVTMPERTTTSQMMARLGLFDSAKDAERRGFRGPIPEGFTDFMGVGKAKHRVTVLKITQPSYD